MIRIHGIRPQPRDGQPAGIFVANHTSMIDFMVLLQVSCKSCKCPSTCLAPASMN